MFVCGTQSRIAYDPNIVFTAVLTVVGAGMNMIWTNLFDVPWLTCLKHLALPHNKTETINLSDHEAVTSHLYLWKALEFSFF